MGQKLAVVRQVGQGIRQMALNMMSMLIWGRMHNHPFKYAAKTSSRTYVCIFDALQAYESFKLGS